MPKGPRRTLLVGCVLFGLGLGFFLGRWSASEDGKSSLTPRAEGQSLPAEISSEVMEESARTARSSIEQSLVYAGLPQASTYPNPIRVLENEGYVVGYDSIRMNPAWSAYRLFRVGSGTSPPRPDNYYVDTRTKAQTSPNAYRYSGYDRGHLAPNYGIATRYGVQAQYETFLMSNIVPQTPELNRQLWNRLEQRIARQYAMTFEEIWITTGPIYDSNVQRLSSGVEIPDAFFKIVLDEEAGKPRALAFEMPQNVQGSERSSQFLTSVDQVEAHTGLDFFAELPDALEDSLEAARASQLWGESAVDAGAMKVYITATGKRYHYEHCRYAKTAFSSATIAEAKRRGLTACRVCQPP